MAHNYLQLYPGLVVAVAVAGVQSVVVDLVTAEYLIPLPLLLVALWVTHCCHVRFLAGVPGLGSLVGLGGGGWGGQAEAVVLVASRGLTLTV